MELVFVMVDGFEMNHRIVLRNLSQLCFQIGKNSLVEYGLSVFSDDHNMVVTEIDIMGGMDKIHTCIVPYRKNATGITPSLDLTVGDLSNDR